MRQRREPSPMGRILILLIDAAILGLAAVRAWTGRRPQPEGIVAVAKRLIPRWVRLAMVGWMGIILAFGAAVFIRYWTPPAPGQPIPFSHHLHATTKRLSCFFCHPTAMVSANAGMPPVEKCLLCHNVIASNFPPIRRIRDHYRRGASIPWVRVNWIPDFVRFSHECHLARGFDCGECHGNVKAMDRVGQPNRFDMNFCVTCHWRNNASDSCFICHY